MEELAWNPCPDDDVEMWEECYKTTSSPTMSSQICTAMIILNLQTEEDDDGNKFFADRYKVNKDAGEYEVWTGLRMWLPNETNASVNEDAGSVTYQLMDWSGATALTAVALAASAALLQ